MTSGAPDRDALVALLDFYVASGIDLALDETPHNRFDQADGPEASAVARPAPTAFRPIEPAAPRPAQPRAAMAAPDMVAGDARRRAGEARTLDELEAMVAGFDGCALKGSAKRLAFADGAAGSRVMLLGEAPGSEEDRAGRPFVGRAGQLLDRMLAAIDLDRTAVYIANVVPWRPPGDRTPTPAEIAICLPFAVRQIELAAPEILVTVGSAATQSILGTTDGITRMRGRWFERTVGARQLRVLPMLHPAYLLRQPLHKRVAWRDLRLLRLALDGAAEPARVEPT